MKPTTGINLVKKDNFVRLTDKENIADDIRKLYVGKVKAIKIQKNKRKLDDRDPMGAKQAIPS